MGKRGNSARLLAHYRYSAAIKAILVSFGLLNAVSVAKAEDNTNAAQGWLSALNFKPSASDSSTDKSSLVNAFDWASVSTQSSTQLTIEYLNWRRNNPNSVSLTAPNGTTRYTSFTSTDLNIDSKVSQGVKATLEGEILDVPVEFSGFFGTPFQSAVLATGLSTGTGTSSIRTNTPYANPATNPNGAPFNYTNSQNIAQLYTNYSNQIYGAEGNVKSAFGIPGLLLGVRTLYYGEDLNTVTEKLASTTALDTVTVQTRNYMVGPQIGVEGMFDLGDGIKIGGSAKAALFGNILERERSYQSRNQTQTRSLQNFTYGATASEAYEINPRIEIAVIPGVNLNASGTLLWLNNLSTVFPQYATVTDLSDRNLRATDRAFFYGWQAGLSIDLDAIGKYSPPAMGKRFLEAKILENGGATPLPFVLYGEINRMALSWNDGVQSATRIVDNSTSPSVFGFNSAAEISRGWTTGIHAEAGLEWERSVQVSQTQPGGETDWAPELRYLEWWLRSNEYGKISAGQTATSTRGLVTIDLSDTNTAVSADIGQMGGNLNLRAADSLDLGPGSISTRTALGDFFGGASIDTLRRVVVRYDTPTIAGFTASVSAWDRFWDAAIRYRLDLPDWSFRAGIGYLQDQDPGERDALGFTKNRKELKGGASLMHNPTGMFVSGAFLYRQFGGFDSSDQATFGENLVNVFGDVIPGTTRPELRYGYLKTGVREHYSDLGDTKFYAETAVANNGITGLQEGGPKLVTTSQVNMYGAGVMQDVDAYNSKIYLGYRRFAFNIEGLRDSSTFGSISSPSPIKDIGLIYSGIDVKF